MICFEGQISKDARRRVLKDYFKVFIWVSAFAVILGVIPLIIFFTVPASQGSFAFFFLCITLLPLCLLIALIILLMPVSDKPYPAKIEIDDGYITCCFNKVTSLYRGSTYQSLEHVKKVIDFGEFYCVYFYYPHRIFGCICQKDLLTQGTIEDFETLFEAKIERKIK